MNINATVENLRKMLDFMGWERTTIPYYNLILPKEACGYNYRSEKVFFYTKEGLINYHGFNATKSSDAKREDISIDGIVPTQTWLNRVYSHLSDEVKIRATSKAKKSGMFGGAWLLLKFKGLGFIELN